MPKSHYVTVKAPKPGSYYVWASILTEVWELNSRCSFYYGDQNGKPLPSTAYDTIELAIEAKGQGGIFDEFRNRSLTHNSVDGSILLLPVQFMANLSVKSRISNQQNLRKIDYLYNGVGIGSYTLPTTTFKSDGTLMNRTTISNFGGRTEYYYTGERFQYVAEYQVGFDSHFDSYGRPLYQTGKRRSYDLTQSPANWQDDVSDYQYVKIGQFLAPSISSSSIEDIRKDLTNLFIPKQPLQASQSDSMLSQLYKTLNIPNINNIANVCDIKGIGKQIKGISQSLQKLATVKSGRVAATSVANLYLAKRYGVDTTAMDLEERFRWIMQNCNFPPKAVEHNTARADYTETIPGTQMSITRTDRWHLYREPYKMGILKALGFNPSIANVWDALPYTFVVDWFLEIGDELERLNVDKVLQTEIKIKSLMASQSLSAPFRGLLGHFICDLTISSYSRWKMETFPDYSINTNVNLVPAKRAWDGTALLVSHL